MPRGVYNRINNTGSLGKHWKLTEENKRKISKGRKGIKFTEAHRKKLSEAVKGEKNGHWIDGRKKENEKIRNNIETRLWREAVFARDNWTCQKCKNKKGGNFQSHHIKNFSQYLGLRFAIDNGITFCKNCHQLFHKIYGRRNNIKEQLEEFLSA